MFQLKLATGAVLMWALAAAPSAAAPPTAQVFQDHCLSVSPSDQLAKARADGFVTPPTVFMSAFPAGLVDNATFLWRVYDGGADMLILGKASANSPLGPGFDGDICGVASIPGQENPVDEMKAVLGVAPITAGDRQIFAYTETGGKRTAVDASKPAELNRLMTSGNLRIALGLVQKQEKGQSEVMVVMIPRAK